MKRWNVSDLCNETIAIYTTDVFQSKITRLYNYYPILSSTDPIPININIIVYRLSSGSIV